MNKTGIILLVIVILLQLLTLVKLGWEKAYAGEGEQYFMRCVTTTAEENPLYYFHVVTHERGQRVR